MNSEVIEKNKEQRTPSEEELKATLRKVRAFLRNTDKQLDEERDRLSAIQRNVKKYLKEVTECLNVKTRDTSTSYNSQYETGALSNWIDWPSVKTLLAIDKGATDVQLGQINKILFAMSRNGRTPKDFQDFIDFLRNEVFPLSRQEELVEKVKKKANRDFPDLTFEIPSPTWADSELFKAPIGMP